MCFKVVFFLFAALLLISPTKWLSWEDEKAIIPQSPSAVAPPPPPPHEPQSSNWLVLTWTPGYCLYYDCLDSKMPKTEMFIVHGLWPVDSNGNVLTNQPVSDPKKIEDIVTMLQSSAKNVGREMDKYWPSLYSESSNLGFWLKEWNKHGTQQDVLGLKEYFVRPIHKAIQIDVWNTLSRGGIKPSNSKAYPQEKYMAAIRRQTKGAGDPAVLLCNQREKNVLSEVVVCLNKFANAYTPCHVPQNLHGLCDREKDIRFLPLPH